MAGMFMGITNTPQAQLKLVSTGFDMGQWAIWYIRDVLMSTDILVKDGIVIVWAPGGVFMYYEHTTDALPLDEYHLMLSKL